MGGGGLLPALSASTSRQRTQMRHMRACMQCYACSRGPAVAHVVRTDRPAQQQPRSATSHHCCSPRSTPAGRVRAASRPAAANRRAAQLSGVRAAPRRCRGGTDERERFRPPNLEHRPAPRPRARSRPLKCGPVLLGDCYLNIRQRVKCASGVCSRRFIHAIFHGTDWRWG